MADPGELPVTQVDIRAGVRPDTMWYDKPAGLLPARPAPPGTTAGYDECALGRLQSIHAAKRPRLHPDAIAELLEPHDAA